MIRPHVDRLKRWQELKVKNRPVSLAKDYDGLFLLFLSLIFRINVAKVIENINASNTDTFIPFQE